MTPWRRAGVALVMAVTGVVWTITGLLPGAPPDAVGLLLLLSTGFSAGLLVAGWAGRSGVAGLVMTCLATAAALLLGAALFGLVLAPPAGAVIVAATTLRMAAARPVLIVILLAGACVAHVIARRRAVATALP